MSENIVFCYFTRRDTATAIGIKPNRKYAMRLLLDQQLMQYRVRKSLSLVRILVAVSTLFAVIISAPCFVFCNNATETTVRRG